MKKAILSLLIALPLTQASAQYKLQHSPVAAPQKTETNRVIRKLVDIPVSNDANKTAANEPRWYNHWEALATQNGLDRNDVDLSSALLMWQDSTVNYGGVNSAFGIQWLSAAEVLAPNTSLYNTNNATNRGKLRVTTENYTVDSVMIRGFYERPFNTYDDTLVLTFIPDSTGSNKLLFLTFGGNTGVNHNIDSAVAVLWPRASYLLPNTMPNGLHQTSYSYGTGATGSPRRVRIVLNQARFIDSLADGSQLFKAPVGITVPAGGRIAMSVTFKSGTNYTPGTPYTNYNRFFLLSHETDQDGFVLYPNSDQNMSFLASKDSTSKAVSSDLSYYIPTIAFNGTGANNFNSEIHDISWRVSCQSCQRVSVGDINNVQIGNAYPNPANNTLSIPVSVKSSASVSVSISNLLGQVLEVKNLGNIAGGQSKTAVFNTVDLSNGIYIYTVESDGVRTSERVTVAH